jgi:hypothetical protein
MATPMFADEMIQAIANGPSFTRAHIRTRESLFRNLAIIARAQCAYAHHTEHTYTKENQWREIHRAAITAYKTVTGKELDRAIQTIPGPAGE